MYISESWRKDKKYVAIFDNGMQTHFGAKNSLTYLDHLDNKKRENYLKRHMVREDWENPYSAGALSRWILWENPNINKNIIDFKKRFNL